jgi:hypothetical protein
MRTEAQPSLWRKRRPAQKLRALLTALWRSTTLVSRIATFPDRVCRATLKDTQDKGEGKGKKRSPPTNGENGLMHKDRLARVVKELLETQGGD